MKRSLLKLSLLATLLLIASGGAFAQQEAMYSQYMFNGLVLNPAYAGSHDGLSAASLYRNQWIGVEGAPVTQTLAVHAPLTKYNVGLGLTVVNDRVGVSKSLSMNAAYAFRIKMDRGVFAMGLQAGAVKYQADYSQVELNPQGRPDAMFGGAGTFLLFNFGTGFYYHTDKYYVGGSIPSLTKPRLAGWGDESALPEHVRHFYLNGGYVFTLNENLKVKPSALVKIVEGAPIQVDINTNLWLHDFIGLGASYRTSNALVGLLELQVARKFRVGYAYDHPQGAFSRPANTHELMLRFDVFSSDHRYVSPRLF